MTDDEPPTAVTFADHYRSRKYVDLRLITAIGLQLDVHRLVVCSQSPVLDAKAKNGTKIIELDADDDATTVEQMIEWMYGIDDQDLLMDRKTLDEVVALGPDFVCGEILAVAGLAVLAGKYRVPKLEAQALELVNLLIATLTSLPSVLEVAHQLASDDALGTVQRNLLSHALDLGHVRGSGTTTLVDSEAKPQMRSKRSGSQVPVETGQDSSPSNMNVSPNRTYAATANRSHTFENQQTTHHSRPLTPTFTPINIYTPTPSPTEPAPTSNPNPPTTPTPSPSPTKATPKKRPLQSSLLLSTALPPNSPPQGPHCHCHSSPADPTLVQCVSCSKLFHPRCVGKGMFARATYGLRDEVGYMLRDVERFCREDGGGDGEAEGDGEGEGEEFKCGEC